MQGVLANQAGVVALSQVAVDRQAVVVEVRGEGSAAGDGAILRAMGLTAGAVVRVCRVGEPTIVAVMCHRGCHCASGRIGLARELAGRVMVSVAPAGADAEA